MKLIAGKRYKGLFSESFLKQGIESIWMPGNPLFDDRLACHADLSIFCSENKHVFVSKGYDHEIVNLLTIEGYDVKIVSEEEGSFYPKDTRLCVCDTGRYLIYNPETTDPALIDSLPDRIHIQVAQSYARCAVSVITEDSIITSDEGIIKAAAKCGMDVLKIQSGYIRLPGFNYGFIGGATVKLMNGNIGFFGDPATHPDGTSIRDFIMQKGLKMQIFARGTLLDIGGAIALP